MPALRDLGVPAGETHAVVGLTGAGKSTIVKLLLRLYEPTSGRVTVDGVDVRDLTFGDLRGSIGLVSQDVFLFDGTVRENIAYGDPDAPAEAVEEAARLAEAHEFISALSDGYDTLVEERAEAQRSEEAAPEHREGYLPDPADRILREDVARRGRDGRREAQSAPPSARSV